MSHITQFIFFKVKPSVRPGDPASEDGKALLKALDITKHQSAYHSSAWGHAVEDENTIAWAVEWADARGSAHTDNLNPFLDATAKVPLIALYTALSPAGNGTDSLVENPVTELCALAFPDSFSAAESKDLLGYLSNFRTALMEELPAASRPESWAVGQVDRPSTIPHPESPSGRAVVHLCAIGWETVELHKEAKKTDQFGRGIAPIRERMLPAVPGLEMKHVSFQKL